MECFLSVDMTVNGCCGTLFVHCEDVALMVNKKTDWLVARQDFFQAERMLGKRRVEFRVSRDADRSKINGLC